MSLEATGLAPAPRYPATAAIEHRRTDAKGAGYGRVHQHLGATLAALSLPFLSAGRGPGARATTFLPLTRSSGFPKRP